MQKLLNFNAAQAKALSAILDAPERAAETMSYCECAGFLYVLACAPEMVPPSDWLFMIVDESDMAEVEAMMPALMSLYNELNRQVQEQDVRALPNCAVLDDAMANFDDEAPMKQWCTGFIKGYSWLEEMWTDVMPEEVSEDFNAHLIILSFFSSRKIAEEFVRENADGELTIEVLAEDMQTVLPQAMEVFASIGLTMQRTLSDYESPKEPAVSDKIGRNELCPCGSGKKYKKCCGNVVLH